LSAGDRRRPRVRLSWLVGALLATVLAAMLAIAGLASGEGGDDSSRSPDGGAGVTTVPPSVLEGGPVVDATQDPVVSKRVQPRTIALTFDDGPDPRWTPQILAVLAKYRVPATFFVVGSLATRHPELVRAIRDSGSELGAHTFTHPNLSEVGRWRLERELYQTQLALAGGAGVTTYLLRPPYSSTASALDDLGYTTVRDVGARGYLAIFSTTDGRDWSRPGVDAIVRNSTPPDGEGAIVLLHDAGGDRSQTVAALDRLIPQLIGQGYRFTTVTGAAGIPAANQPAGARDRLTGQIMLGLVAASALVVGGLHWIVLGVGVLVVVRLLLMVAVAGRHARRRHDPGWRWGPPVTEPVTVIMPAYNEAANIEVAVRSVVANTHPLEVLVVDDGSTDGTADLVVRLGLPQVRVIRQPNGGKAAALNTGIANARHELIVMIDGDTRLEPDTVGRLVQPFADPRVGAVSGNVKIANRTGLLGRLQHVEYVVGFNVDRRVHDVLGSMCTIPGAAGAFRRQALVDVGGLSPQTLAEDTDLTIAVGRAGWRMVYEESALAWTEAPATLDQLWQQRFRWTYGTIQAVWKHRSAIRERGAAGRLGRLGLLQILVFQILLPVAAPVIDICCLYGLLFGDPVTTLALWSAVLAVQAAAAGYAFHLDREPKRVLLLIPLQQLVYRQLMYVVLAQSLATAAAGVRVRWQRIRRLGVLDLPQRTPAPPRAERPPRRDRWFDVLRAAALVRVVVYHTLGYGWLSLVFPAMGVMFALGGSLAARSMRRTPAGEVIGHRIRRLLPPLWLFGAILVPLMLWHGWTRESDEYALNWAELALWVFPVLDPPHSSWGTDAAAVLWYVRAYLWFVLLTPALLGVFRRWPVTTVLAPIAVVAVDAMVGSPLAGLAHVGPGILDFCTFGACWVLGFAHREGTLRRIHPFMLVGVAVTAIGLGAAWTVTHPLPDGTLDLNEIPLGQALISAGAVLVFMRISPELAWLDRLPALRRLVAVANARAVTIYLWHNVAIALAVPVMDRLAWYSPGAHLGITALLLPIAVLVFGWVEDLAARRQLRLLPADADPPPAPRARPLDDRRVATVSS